MKTLYESILDDEEDVMDNISSSVAEEWLKKNSRGKYKLMKLKNGNYKIWGDLHIKNCEDKEVFPLNISFMEGNLFIDNCNFYSLRGLFVDEVITYNINVSISNCPNLTDLKGLPWWIKGDLNISNCRSLKSLEGISKFVEGDISLMKIGKKFKPEQVKNLSKLTYNVFCSLEEDEMLITEAVNEPHLYRLIEFINNKSKSGSGIDFKNLMHYKYNGISWDKVTSEYVTVYKEINSKALTECRNILSGKVPGLIATMNYDHEYHYLFNDDKQMFIIGGYNSGWGKVNTTEAINLIKGENQLVIFKLTYGDTPDGVLAGLNAFAKQKDRAVAKNGMILVGLKDDEYKEYYKKLAKENQERYKKVLAKLKAERDEDIDFLSKQVGDLLDRFMKFNTQVLSGKIKIATYELDRINEYFYGSKEYVGYSGKRHSNPYVGTDGLLSIYSKLGSVFLRYKEGNNPDYYQNNLAGYKNALRQKISECDVRLKEYNM